MVEARTFDFAFDPETRTKEIFYHIFQPIFMGNGNRELNLDQVRQAFEAQMGDELDGQARLTIEHIFHAADTDNSGTLSKREIMNVIRESLTQGVFTEFFREMD